MSVRVRQRASRHEPNLLVAGEIAILRHREAIVAEELAQTQARLETETARLSALRERLNRLLNVLSRRVGEIYKSDEPDALTKRFGSSGQAGGSYCSSTSEAPRSRCEPFNVC